jgi:acetyl esterase/lipase
MFHGGGWISGDKTAYHFEAEYFCSHGIACACIGYRLAPLHQFPAATQDALSAVAFLRQNAAELQLDANRLVAFGNSAGGHLACIAGLQQEFPNGEPAQNTNAVVSICAITDVRNPDESQYPIAMSFLEQFMGQSHSESPESYANASPITHIRENAPPFLIFHGSNDEIVPADQARQLFLALTQSGVSAELHIMENEGHSFSMPSWLKIREQTVEFVKTL